MLKRIRQFRAVQRRKLSTASSPYNNYTKLRAFPFRVHPELALKVLAPIAAGACNQRKLWPSIGASLQVRFALPFFNFDFLRPVRFSAVYFPGWIVTGEVEANVTYKGIQGKESAWFDDTYIPGSSSMRVLSAAPLKFPFFMERKTVPFTSSLLHQHGEPVQCIPFSTSPLSILDAVASHLPSRSIKINGDLSFDPSSVKPNLMSAYPVLLPLYLAQYEIKDGNKDSADNTFTFILQAHDIERNSLMCENLSKIDESTRGFFVRCSEFYGHESSLGEVYTFFSECTRVSIPDVSMSNQHIPKSVSEWLEEILSSSRNIETLADSSLGVIGKGDEDLRIRPIDSGVHLKMYAEFTKSIIMRKKFLNNVTSLEKNSESLQSALKLSESKERVEKEIKDLEAKRDVFTPKWWVDWLALNRPKSKNTKRGR